ncbi:LysR family transcriptional regulator substrate-binding protein [Streptomyces sp. NBC_01190]|uniref:LysR family transcriptional regulator substrate-binding protein n=1 Tax=Streptomyces sp. NBC_01190 TaxID=2903767 RepID=UPI003864C403|nr:LysR family transcriptional regulator substrate-binding protein [Streptomyces sp. NBC_01190]
MTGAEVPPSFRLAYVPGVTPAKWVRIWQERLPAVPLTLVAVPAAEVAQSLRDGDADAALLRLPVDRTEFSAIPLYTETTVVVVPKDHVVAAVEEVATEDLADEIVLRPLDDTLEWVRPPGQPAKERPATTADAFELVAAGVGLLVVPQSLARLHHRRDLTYRPLVKSAESPESHVALSWPQDETTDLVEQFIGIVRGRTVNSTRGRPAPAQPPAEAPAKDKRGGSGEARRKPAPGKSGGGKNARSAAGSPKPAKRGKPRRRS